MPVVVMVLGFGLLAVALRLMLGSMDRTRIAEYIEGRGGRVVSVAWAPFGTGWFGEKNARIYEVVYYDREGQQHWATCKTSMFGGVYWTQDTVTHKKPGWFDRVPARNEAGRPIVKEIGSTAVGDEEAGDEVSRLREENARLRAELERRRGWDDRQSS